MSQATVLVTGGAGYIGSHAALELGNQGYGVVVLDNLTYGHREFAESVLKVPFIEGDISDASLLDSVLSEHSIDAVMHFAAFSQAGESVELPGKYYRNNIGGTLTLLESMVRAGVRNMVFSSTCALYGIPDVVPISEETAQNPINPYGETKRVVECMLRDFDAAHGLRYVALRYFNAAGADPEGRLGELHDPETHLIPLVLDAAIGKRTDIRVFGTDYPTPDGTCIRDYIHVCDLAGAHVLGLEYLLDDRPSDVFNLGTGTGHSVREVIETCREVTGHDIPVVEEGRRPGDPPKLVATNAKAGRILGWSAQYPDLGDTVAHAWNWHRKISS